MTRLRHYLWACMALVSISFAGCSPGDDPVEPAPPGLSMECSIDSFTIEGVANGLSSGSKITFKVSQYGSTIEGTCMAWLNLAQPEKLAASFTFTGKEVRVDGVVQVSGQTVNSFRNEITYTVVAEDGTTTKDYKVSLLCPQVNGELPALHFKTDGPVVNKTDYVTSLLEIQGNGITEGLWDFSKEKVEIRFRGNSTMDATKKPYRVKFPVKYSPLGLNHAEARSWTLLADDADKTLSRNAIAFALSRYLFATGGHDPSTVLFTAAHKHVNLYMNGAFIGVYTMSDHLERDPGRINIESLKVGDAESKRSGGYLLEVDVHASAASEPSYFASSRGMKITPKYPEDMLPGGVEHTYIKNYVKMAEDALYGSNYAHPTDGWRKYWDEATAVDYLIINELCGNPDGYSSTYVYKKRGIDKFFFGPVWDFDKAFDNDSRTANPKTSLMVYNGFYSMIDNPEVSVQKGLHWFRRMWSDDSFKRAVKTRWNTHKAQLKSTALQILQDDPKRMPLSVKANFTIWNIKAQEIWGAIPNVTSYDQGVEILRTYINNRYDWLDAEFNKVQ